MESNEQSNAAPQGNENATQKLASDERGESDRASSPAGAAPDQPTAQAGLVERLRVIAAVGYKTDRQLIGACTEAADTIAAQQAEIAELKRKIEVWEIILNLCTEQVGIDTPYGEIPGSIAELKRQLAEAKEERNLLHSIAARHLEGKERAEQERDKAIKQRDLWDEACQQAKAERDALKADAERYRQELQNIIGCDMREMREDFGDGADEQFRLWAQNRARTAIDAARRGE